MSLAMEDAMEVEHDIRDAQYDSPMAEIGPPLTKQMSEGIVSEDGHHCPVMDFLTEHMQSSFGNLSSQVRTEDDHSAKPAIAGRRIAVPRGTSRNSSRGNFPASSHATINLDRREFNKLLQQTTPHPHSLGQSDTYKPVKSIDKAMAEFEHRRGGDRRPYNGGGRKRGREDDDTYDRRDRPQNRRRHNDRYHDGPPPGSRLRKQLLSVAESGMRNPEEEVQSIAKLAVQHYGDDYVRNTFCDNTLSLVSEQPCKIVFVAAAVQHVNLEKPELVQELLGKAGDLAQQYLDAGDWTRFKLILRFLACLQGLYEDEGVFPILEELFQRTIDLQTASSEDAVGLELVKIILLTIPYLVSSSATGLDERVAELLEKTDIVANAPHILENLVDPYPTEDAEQKPMPCLSILATLQKQLQNEATNGWPLSCIPRVFRADTTKVEDGQNGDSETTGSQKHSFPSINVPENINPGPKTLFPGIYFSLFADQDIESVPPTSNLASTIIRDSIVDTVNLLDYNRNVAARFLIELDCYWAPGTFVKRSTAFDKLKDIPEGRSTWKPEDMVVDAVFSQIMQLPKPECKLVYYHSLITEACKLAPAAIAPSLGRAIRFLFRNIQIMDLELVYRYMDWFAHHLSNFDFRWKWTEWLDEINNPDMHPRKSFILGALDKEIRLSFAKRVVPTIPEPWQPLITEGQMKDLPDFKFDSDQEPYAQQGRELYKQVRSKTTDEAEVQRLLDEVSSLATEQGADPHVASTDVFMTVICHVGSKSMSHVLSSIDKSKERLLAVGPTSEVARRQIITAVVEYWRFHPGTAVNIIDKLLNYTILTPMSVIEWALQYKLDRGRALAQIHIYEMVATTMTKVTNRVRQVVLACTDPALAPEQKSIVDETLVRERQSMRDLFAAIEDAVRPVSEGNQDDMIEAFDSETTEYGLLRTWGDKWLRVWRRKAAIEEATVGEAAVAAAVEVRKVVAEINAARAAREAEMQAEAAAEAEKVANGNDDDGDRRMETVDDEVV